jgi:hypothetical protein
VWHQQQCMTEHVHAAVWCITTQQLETDVLMLSHADLSHIKLQLEQQQLGACSVAPAVAPQYMPCCQRTSLLLRMICVCTHLCQLRL